MTHDDYQHLVNRISDRYQLGQSRAAAAVNTSMLETYWSIGEYIVEYEQGGKAKAEYGKGLLESLSKDLSLLDGKGFSVSNIQRMRQLYTVYPICAELPHKLGRSTPQY